MLHRPVELAALTGKVKQYFIWTVIRLYIQVEFAGENADFPQEETPTVLWALRSVLEAVVAQWGDSERFGVRANQELMEFAILLGALRIPGNLRTNRPSARFRSDSLIRSSCVKRGLIS